MSLSTWEVASGIADRYKGEDAEWRNKLADDIDKAIRLAVKREREETLAYLINTAQGTQGAEVWRALFAEILETTRRLI